MVLNEWRVAKPRAARHVTSDVTVWQSYRPHKQHIDLCQHANRVQLAASATD